jgi:Tol biopolymer transport system component
MEVVMASRTMIFCALLYLAPFHWTAEGAPCVLNQFTALTQVAEGYTDSVQIDAIGKHVVWEGDADPLGANMDRNTEIFAYDVSNGRLTQVTVTTTWGAGSPDISADGEWVAFESTGDHVGRNSDGNREVFLYQWSTGAIMQVTETVGVNNFRPRLNGDGSRLAFLSEANLAGTNADGNKELFYSDDRGLTYSQVTDTDAGIRSPNFPAINYLGDRIAFSSRNDFVGDNGDRNEEVFVYDIPSRTFFQATDGTGGCSSQVPGEEGPVFDLSGNLVVLMSDCDFNGGNQDGSFEACVADLKKGSVEQITQSSVDTYGMSISGDGRLVAMSSRGGNFVGDNDDGSNEIFLFDRTNRNFTQLTNGPSDTNSYEGSLNVDGTAVGFSSGGNFDGSNPEGNDEPYLVSCTPTLRAPVGANLFYYDPVWFPMLDPTVAGTSPIGLGPAAVGGDRFSLELKLGRFSSGVDLYVLVYMPAIDAVNIYSLSPDLRLQEVTRGYLPWVNAAAGPFDAALLRYIPTTALPSGTYYFGLMATAPGDLSHYYLWVTSVSLP